jgi:hypothetical protein
LSELTRRLSHVELPLMYTTLFHVHLMRVTISY